MDSIFPSLPPTMTTLLVLSIKATALLTLALILRALLRGTSASTRHFLLSGAIITAAALPLLATIAPDWQPPVPTILRSRLAPGPTSPPSAEMTAGTRMAASSESRFKINQARPSMKLPAAADAITVLWLLGTVIVAGRVLIGLSACARRRQHSNAPEFRDIRRLVESASRTIGLRKGVDVIVSERTRVPHISGIIKPALFLPRDVLLWPRERLMSMLLHELAHVKRKDHIIWPLSNLAVSWLWFNPLVWLALAQMKRDRERACDDCVLACGNSEISYAQHLLEACTALKVSAGWAPVSLLFARKNEVKERIIYMFRRGVDHRPISRTKQLVFAALLITVSIPLISITGFSNTVTLRDVSPGEREAVVATLEEFYSQLSDGSDYQVLSSRFLTSDYFDDPNLTLESLDEAVWQPVFDNTIALISEKGVGIAKEVRCKLVSIERDGAELVVTQQLDVIADRTEGAIEYEDEAGVIIRRPRSDNGRGTVTEDCRLVNALTQQIRFRQEDGFLKISRFDDAVAIMRMGTDNPAGPIFLVWMENIDAQTTPFGAGIFKVIPRDIIPDAHNTKFTLEK